ncbi:MAG: ankyrin repeat domain-containing protein [Gammaproteobacteria bacterium]|nr:ankyrin repeat domain-containing protein [Gammaproteobacteria bacterium]NIM74538.1 ankyrin repeat domain-containing protein [Gammaproteobacteria bacterium]NIO26371.1 ankyrin repeat domain-containing protein [Gammaproteobacteria bacterium]NIO66923.1 ankyrin repeat domain-containing protein [Gammaproteobacteria bacterium]NIP44933.1 ankyrin repeat domain-containing protein [Gammaproteobacteria bacterium]
MIFSSLRASARLAALLLAASVVAVHAQPVANEEYLSALERGDLDTAARLVPSGVDVDARRSDGKTLLILAAKENDVILVRRLIAAGANVNATTNNGGTALMFAAIRGDVETQRLLVAAGADVDAIGGFDWTALTVAAVKGHTAAVRQLLASGASPNLADIYGWTPLMRAVYEEREQVVWALLEQAGIDLDQKNDQGATALHLAAVKGNARLARALLSAGASPVIQDREGRTPAMLAVSVGHAEMAALLEARATH